MTEGIYISFSSFKAVKLNRWVNLLKWTIYFCFATLLSWAMKIRSYHLHILISSNKGSSKPSFPLRVAFTTNNYFINFNFYHSFFHLLVSRALPTISLFSSTSHVFHVFLRPANVLNNSRRPRLPINFMSQKMFFFMPIKISWLLPLTDVHILKC